MRDVCCDALRAGMGSKRVASPAAMMELRRRWELVTDAVNRDQSARPSPGVLVGVSTRLGAASEKALQRFVELLTVTYPGRYEVRALASRARTHLGACVIFGATGGVLFGARASGVLTDFALVAFAIAALQMVYAVQVRRVELLVQRTTSIAARR